MNITTNMVFVELINLASYNTSVVVNNQLLKLKFTWNERLNIRTLMITNSEDVCYLQNTIIYPNETYKLNYNAILSDLNYNLQLINVSRNSNNLYNWKNNYTLAFFEVIDNDE